MKTDVKLKSDSDRRAWPIYAAAALTGLTCAMFGDEEPDPKGCVELAAKMADQMLEQERQRR